MNTLTCNFCCTEYESTDHVDRNEEGFWCDVCEGYSFFDTDKEKNDRKFALILEAKSKVNDPATRNKKKKLNKRISPLRYPGGKSKISDYILGHINEQKTDYFISPFSGGASVELALLYSGVVKKLLLNDYDFGVYSLFKIIKTFPDALISLIMSQRPTHEDFIRSRDTIKKKYENCDIFEAAWNLLLVNRLAYSGIYKANPLGGRKGELGKLLSRWNAEDLCRRIRTIHSMADNFTIENEDALEFIETHYWLNNSTMFIDPPYYEQGKHMYLHYYT